MRKCLFCKNKIKGSNIKIQIKHVTGTDKIKPGRYCICEKCLPNLEWNLDEVVQQIGAKSMEVRWPISMIDDKISVINSEG